MTNYERLVEAARAFVRQVRVVGVGQPGSYWDSGEAEVEALRQSLAELDAQGEGLPESYIEDCQAKAKSWDRPTLEAQYMNAVEGIWTLTTELSRERRLRADALKIAPPMGSEPEGDTVWIGRMGSAEEMLGRFCTIGKFDPADRHWAFHYHSSKDAAQTFAKSMTEHGSPAIAIEVVEYYAPPPQTEPRRK